jgi:hypothetical protein
MNNMLMIASLPLKTTYIPMKKQHFFLLLYILFPLFGFGQQERKVYNFNPGWKLFIGDLLKTPLGKPLPYHMRGMKTRLLKSR